MCTNPNYLPSKGMHVLCGKCFECQKKYSTAWSWRIMFESKQYYRNCMITLTYSPEYLPAGGTLRKEDLQKFMKRLRKRFNDKTIRFFACGEYGERNGRPHYHVIIFNEDFSDDRYLFFRSKKDGDVFRSPTLEKLWSLGQSSIINVSEHSALYCAKYLQKMNTKPILSELSKRSFDYSAADLVRKKFDDGRLVPFVQMSRRPGIGFNAFHKELLASDKLYYDGRTIQLPRFYFKLGEKFYPEAAAVISDERVERAKNNIPDYDSIKYRCKKYKKVFGKYIDSKGVFKDFTKK